MTSIWSLAVGMLALALLVAAIGLLVRGRQSESAEAALSNAVKRGNNAALAATAAAESAKPWWKRLADELTSLGQQFAGGRLQQLLLAEEDRMLLDQAGYGHSQGQAVFLAARLLAAVALPVLVIVFSDASGMRWLILLAAAMAAGLLLPKFGLRLWAKRIQKTVHDELPLFIDLLRLLQGVGFSIDQSLQMLSDKMRLALPVIGRELELANLAYSRGRSREQSLHRLAESFDNEDLRSLVQMIVQVHSHGGAVQEPLKNFGLRLREKRRMNLKEQVGKLSVKMTVVMMVTLLPALLLVLAGPAIIALAGAVSQMGST
ncbi:MAG: type II secretion system F family protein [Stenotrophomonas sp.]